MAPAGREDRKTAREDPRPIPPAPDGTPRLLGEALREGAAHAGSLLALARTELDGNFRAVVSLVAILGTIPVLLIVTFFLGLEAAVKLIAVPFGSEVPAALIVALPFIAAAAALGWLGARRLALSNLEPWRTWREVKRDGEEARKALTPEPR